MSVDTDAYRQYHDDEWGVPVADDRVLFEFLTLEGAQAGLSWSTILNKRAGYQRLFEGFEPERVAGFGKADVERLLADPSIVRHRGKIESTINNARALLSLQDTHGSFASWLWDFVDGEPIQNAWRQLSDIPATTELSDRLSKALKKAGFRFVGSTTLYAFCQAVGLVNDHQVDCFRHAECKALGVSFQP
ncbi:MAG: DNA-3-methyladenine glycosylase I [Gammaproteobacteria bacterium]|nr:DNA-3-methyladenine glycosylase I [Gammaproteobacteria bacterium]